MPLRLPRRLRRLLAPFTWNARDDEMDREMGFHLESHPAAVRPIRNDRRRSDARGAGAIRRPPPAQGTRPRRPDDAASSKISSRDVRHMARGLRKNPGFTIAVILTLALGIGGNTAIFSVVDQLLLRPLPYPGGDRLVTVYEALGVKPGQQIRSTRTHQSVSPANWMDWQTQSRTLERLAAWRTTAMTLTQSGDPTRLAAQMVSAEFFPLLGVGPLLGRTISRRRRPSERAARRRPQPPSLAGPLRRRSEHRRPDDPPQRPADRGDRRDAGGLRLHLPGQRSSGARCSSIARAPWRECGGPIHHRRRPAQ